MTAFIQALSAFGAGVGTSLSPCIYPMIPITIGFLGSASSESEKSKKKILGFFVGQVLTFTSLGVVAVSLGEILGFSAEIPSVKIGTGVLLILFAYFSFFNRLPAFMSKLNNLSNKGSSNSVFGAFIIGASSAAIASPCTSPVVGGMLTAISQIEERFWGISLMFFFSLGLAFLYLILGLGLTKVNHLPKAGRWMTTIHKVSSVILALGGGYFLYQGFSA